LPTTVAPLISTPVGGAITVGLKPGMINIVPADKKEFKSNDPWVILSNFEHVRRFVRPPLERNFYGGQRISLGVNTTKPPKE
jgi:hypothetical protein